MTQRGAFGRYLVVETPHQARIEQFVFGAGFRERGAAFLLISS
jgi:hypothetical protein